MKYKISEYDRNAIEEAVLINEKSGGTLTSLTYGTMAAKQSLKDVLSRGPDKAVFVNDESAAFADASVTASVLAAAVKKIGSYDLIICGEGSADAYSQQVGPRLATLLGNPVITYVSELKVEDGKVVATRKVGNCSEIVTADFPVVITVLPEINKPRLPSLKAVMGAAKKPMEELKPAELGISAADLLPKNRVKCVKGFVMSRKNIVYKSGTAPEKVASLVENLAQEGVL